jgi:betaine lipid synthase
MFQIKLYVKHIYVLTHHFSKGQIEVYDTTRKRLLRGRYCNVSSVFFVANIFSNMHFVMRRSTMLRLCAGQLMKTFPKEFGQSAKNKNGSRVSAMNHYIEEEKEMSESLLSEGRRLAWVDIGGGTGSNVERMNEWFPISNFEKVYIVDITPSMCDIARRRFAKLGWSNVEVICCAAEEFQLPYADKYVDGKPELEIALITFSYSLSMMECVYPVIDRIVKILSPNGIVGVADFYVSGKRSSADPTRQLSWFKRWFWSIWFDFDGIYLHPSRREYLEHKFATVKMASHLNPFINGVVYIPYYIWIGSQKEPVDSNASVISTLSTLADYATDSDNEGI